MCVCVCVCVFTCAHARLIDFKIITIVNVSVDCLFGNLLSLYCCQCLMHVYVTATVKRLFKQFKKRPTIARFASQNGMNKKLFTSAVTRFTRLVLRDKATQKELSPVVQKIERGDGHVDDLWPYFLTFAQVEFPIVDRYDSLKNLSDLTVPSDWFPQARAMKRKVVYHCGPTNSGKTHHALESFRNASTGVYCGPLRLLAHQVFEMTNQMVRFVTLTGRLYLVGCLSFCLSACLFSCPS